MADHDQPDAGSVLGQSPAPASALELERLRAAQARILEELSAPPPALELERLNAEEVRIRSEIDRLTQSIDAHIESPAQPTENPVHANKQLPN